jgi:NCS2 family nucleobase:cation symporter-2
MSAKETKTHIIYGIDDRPPLLEAVPLGLQHLFAMFLGNITPPLIVAGALGLATGETAFLVQMALLIAGVATIVQAYPIGPIGARIPMIMGTSFAFLGGIISAATQWGMAAAFGACLAASFVEVVMGFAIDKIKRFFPPLVTGIVVMLIGISLIPTGMDYAAGGVGSDNYGSFDNLAIAGVVLLATLLFHQFTKGILSSASVLVGVIIGYIVALFMGKVDFAVVAESGWFSIPQFLPYGIEFHWAPILLLAFVYIISGIETMGDITGTVAATGRPPSAKELRGGLVADGAMSGFATLFGAFPNTSYSQNVGLVNFTGVASRHVAALGGLFLVSLGFIPKVGAVVATIPPSVIGGGGLIMFAMIFTSGVSVLRRFVTFNQRNMIILAVSIGLGLGIESRPDVLQHFSPEIQTFFGEGLMTGGLAALILHQIFPGKETAGSV